MLFWIKGKHQISNQHFNTKVNSWCIKNFRESLVIWIRPSLLNFIWNMWLGIKVTAARFLGGRKNGLDRVTSASEEIKSICDLNSSDSLKWWYKLFSELLRRCHYKLSLGLKVTLHWLLFSLCILALPTIWRYSRTLRHIFFAFVQHLLSRAKYLLNFCIRTESFGTLNEENIM